MNQFNLIFYFILLFSALSYQQNVIELNTRNFDQLVTNTNDQWVIAFSAGDWCPPCVRLRPVFVELAKAVHGQISVKVGKIDAQAEAEITMRYGIRGYPSILYFSGGKKNPSQHQGEQSLKAILQFVYNKNMMIAMKQVSGTDIKKDGNIYVLTSGNFESFFENTKEWLFVKYYTNWCPPCNRMEPEWQKLATYLLSINANVKIAKADLASEPDIEEFVNVHSYPTLLLYPPGKKHFQIFEQYTSDDERTKDALLDFLMSKISNQKSLVPLPPVIKLSDDSFHSVLMKTEDAVFIKVGTAQCPPCQQMEPDWQKLAKTLKQNNKKVLLANLDPNIYQELAQQLPIDGYPSLIYFPAGPKDIGQAEHYRSYDRNHDALYSYLQGKEQTLFLNDDNFNTVLNDNKDDLFFVVFTLSQGCGMCSDLSAILALTQRDILHDIRFVKINTDQNPKLAKKFQITGFPTMKLFHPFSEQTQKRKIESYTGHRHYNVISQWLLQKKSLYEEPAEDSDVIELTDDNFDNIVMNSEKIALITFDTSWCSHCKELKPQINKLAKKMKGKAIIGRVNVEKHEQLKQRFGINAFPTLKLFPAGDKLDAEIPEYQGGKGVNTMYQFLMDKKKSMISYKFHQLTNNKQYKKFCKNRQTCVMAFFPHIRDSSATNRTDYLKTLASIAEATETFAINLLWVQGGDYPELEQFFEIEGLYPTIIVINGDKQQYNIMQAAFEQDKIFKYLRGLLKGKISGISYPYEFPELATTEKWDGQDFAYAEN